MIFSRELDVVKAGTSYVDVDGTMLCLANVVFKEKRKLFGKVIKERYLLRFSGGVTREDTKPYYDSYENVHTFNINEESEAMYEYLVYFNKTELYKAYKEVVKEYNKNLILKADK